MEPRMNGETSEHIEVEVGEMESQAYLYAVTSQTPWWIVSILFHALMIALCALLSMSIGVPPCGNFVCQLTEFVKPLDVERVEPPAPTRPEALLPVKATETDPLGPEPKFNATIPPEILAVAELSDHPETDNPDMPDRQSANGRLGAQLFYSKAGNTDPEGGGGKDGVSLSLDETIGACGSASPGKGGGFGGGEGRGIGLGKGDDGGSFTDRLIGSGRKVRVIRQRGGSPATENAVQRALRWLADHQEADGHWDSVKLGSSKKFDTAVTGLALLTFLGAGHTEKVGAHKEKVQRAVAWLKSKQAANGMIADTSDVAHCGGHGYTTAIATLALAEAAGMGNVKDTREAAQRAVDYCTEVHQAGEGSEKGGWRYGPKQAADISVTGWFIMALKSAKVAGLHVNPAAIEGALCTLDKLELKNAAQGSYGPASKFAYVAGARDSNGRRCAIGNLARQFLGWKRQDLQSNVELFMTDYGTPDWGANGEKVDLYYWYYGTMCVFQQGGDLWTKWNANMVKALVGNQSVNGADTGSWDPKGDYSDSWGRVGQTALSALCLEVYYRYELLK